MRKCFLGRRSNKYFVRFSALLLPESTKRRSNTRKGNPAK